MILELKDGRLMMIMRVYLKSIYVSYSSDGGATWSETDALSGCDTLYLEGMTVSRSDPNQIYICGEYHKTGFAGSGYTRLLLKSTDAGANWSDISAQVDVYDEWSYIQAVAVDPTDADRVYLGSGSWFYRSTNGGDTWVKNTRHGYCIAFDPADSARLYLGSYDNVYISSDYGQTWSSNAGEVNGSVYGMSI